MAKNNISMNRLSFKKLKDAETKINEKVPILDVMNKMGIEINRCGTTYRMLCFYHNDTKEPNLSYIANGKNFVYCFCCRVMRRPVRLWQDYFSKTFEETICDLAPMAGINLADLEGEPSPEELLEKEAIAVNKEILDRLHDSVKYYPDVMEYLQRRYSLDTINKWEIGYCPNGQELLDYLRKEKKFSYNAIKLAGIKPFLFHDRVIYPLKNLYSEVIGFSGRVWGLTPEDEKKRKTRADGSESPKYVNTGASKIFNKSSEMYGLHIARDHIKQVKSKSDKVIIAVEGHPDVIAMHEAGFTNTVGVMSASFNSAAAKALESIGVEKVIFCLDGDRAGRENTLRILSKEAHINQALIEHGSSIRFYAAGIPWGVDPEEYLREKDNVINMKKILKKPMSCLDFYVYNSLRTSEPQTLTEKLDFIFNIRKELQSEIKPAELKVTEKFLYDTLGVDALQVCEYAKGKEYRDEVFKMEDDFIASLLNDEHFRRVAMEIVKPEWLQGNNTCLYRALLQLNANNDFITFETLWDKVVFLGYVKFFKSKRDLEQRLQVRVQNPYDLIYELRKRGRKRKVSDVVTKICAKARNLTEQELVEEIKQQMLIFKADFS